MHRRNDLSGDTEHDGGWTGGPPEGRVSSTKPSKASQATGSGISPGAHATWESLSSSARAEAGTGAYAPRFPPRVNTHPYPHPRGCREGLAARPRHRRGAAGVTMSGAGANPGCSSLRCPPRMEWILRVSGPCYIGQKSQSLRSIVYHLFRNHGVVLTQSHRVSLKVVSLPEGFPSLIGHWEAGLCEHKHPPPMECGEQCWGGGRGVSPRKQHLPWEGHANSGRGRRGKPRDMATLWPLRGQLSLNPREGRAVVCSAWQYEALRAVKEGPSSSGEQPAQAHRAMAVLTIHHATW